MLSLHYAWLLAVQALPVGNPWETPIVTAQATPKGRTEETKVEFSEDEEMFIARMFNLVGQRWSLIAGRTPGRTAEEIEKYWSSTLSSQSGLRNES
ncbi:MYB-like transcription factor ETC1 [Hibiscus syriacus]|uniref:MYB-like transcription factor ETC1 n=1 Tax=Hibiscus syriacus TaxID=106335 RepID=A0A6A3AWG6_HIBSY|nr:MYB-like transcription factor ETC1 [Hibiscus syriacus]